LTLLPGLLAEALQLLAELFIPLLPLQVFGAYPCFSEKTAAATVTTDKRKRRCLKQRLF
jgi:hypothetical protein